MARARMVRWADQRSAQQTEGLINDDDASESDGVGRDESRGGGGVHRQAGGGAAAEEPDPHFALRTSDALRPFPSE